ncbi:isochorismatase family domain-containing protein [Phthorimaea operculella]|nr:isochorismatase family domain-containing protein [Phthorimaea operculella]
MKSFITTVSIKALTSGFIGSLDDLATHSNKKIKALFRNDKGPIYSVSEIVRPVSAFLIVDVQNDFISGSLNISKCNAQQDGSEVVEPINRLLETVPFDCVFYSLDWHPPDHVWGTISRLLETVPFDCVFYSLDWHPPDHVSFIDNVHMRELHVSSPVSADKAQTYDTVVFAGPPPMKQRLWPRHCIQDTWGAELHKDLKIVDGAVKVYKGTNPEVDSYSVFWDNKSLTDTSLSSQLRMRGATDIFICGLAYDVCVGATIADALAIGYRSILIDDASRGLALIDDASRGVDLADIEATKATIVNNNGVILALIDDASRGVDLADIEATKATIINNNGVIVNSDEVLAMVEGRDRRPELGYKLAMELKTAMEDGQ